MSENETPEPTPETPAEPKKPHHRHFKAVDTSMIPKRHRKIKIRADKGVRRKPKVRKKRKDAGKSKLPKVLQPLKALPSRGGGPLSNAEKAAVEALVQSVTSTETEQELQTRGRALGLALGRSSAAIRNEVIRARQRLQERAVLYADIHFQAAQVAATKGDAEPAQWALERITAPAENGKGVERVVQPLKSGEEQSRMPTVNIGLALGGMAAGASLTPSVGVKVSAPVIDVDVEDMP